MLFPFRQAGLVGNSQIVEQDARRAAGIEIEDIPQAQQASNERQIVHSMHNAGGAFRLHEFQAQRICRFSVA